MSKIVLLWASISESSLVTLATTAMGVVGSAIVAMFGYLGQRKARRKPLKARPPFLVAFGLGVLIGVPAVWVMQTRPSQITMILVAAVIIILLQVVSLLVNLEKRRSFGALTQEFRKAGVHHRSNQHIVDMLARLTNTDPNPLASEERSA